MYKIRYKNIDKIHASRYSSFDKRPSGYIDFLKPRQSFYTTRLREHTTSCSSSRAASHETYIVYLCYNVYDQIHRCLFVGLNLRINEMDFYIHVYVD